MWLTCNRNYISGEGYWKLFIKPVPNIEHLHKNVTYIYKHTPQN